MLSQDELNQIRERAEKATKGPWHPFHSDDWMAMNCYGVSTRSNLDSPEEEYADVVALTLYQASRVVDHSSGLYDEDAHFIAHARTDIPALLEHVGEVEKHLQALLRLAEKGDEEFTDEDAHELQRIRQALARKEGV